MEYFQKLFTFVVLISMSERSSSSRVLATEGDDTDIPCFHNTSSNMVKWTKHFPNSATKPRVILVRPVESDIPDAERVALNHGGLIGDKSLRLAAVKKSDEGLYTCEIQTGWGNIISQNTSLKLRDCKIVQSVKAVTNSDTTLPCPLKLSKDQHQKVSWVVLKGDKEDLILQYPNVTQDPRVRFVDAENISLRLSSVKTSDSQWYRCKLQAHMQQCFDVNLKVKDLLHNTPTNIITSDHVAKENIHAGVPTKDPISSHEEGSSGYFTSLVASAISVISVILLVIGLVIYFNKFKKGSNEPNQRSSDFVMQINHTNNNAPFQNLANRESHFYEHVDFDDHKDMLSFKDQ